MPTPISIRPSLRLSSTARSSASRTGFANGSRQMSDENRTRDVRAVSARVVDADGHVLEPADTWLKYLEPSYRERAIRIARDERGYEVLLIDGQPLKTLRGELGALGGIGMDAARLLTRGQMTYAEGS